MVYEATQMTATCQSRVCRVLKLCRHAEVWMSFITQCKHRQLQKRATEGTFSDVTGTEILLSTTEEEIFETHNGTIYIEERPSTSSTG